MTKSTKKETSAQAIWEILREVSESQDRLIESQRKTARLFEESKLETDRLLKESRLETDRLLKESRLETDRQIRETDRRLDKRLRELNDLFTGQWGKLMETLVEGDLIKLLKEKDIEVERTLQNIKSKKFQLDIMAVNGKEVVVVEVKTTLRLKDINSFIEKLKDFKTIFPEYKNKKIYGAVAYLKANESSDKYSEKQGLFVIRAVGSSASITNVATFRPTAF